MSASAKAPRRIVRLEPAPESEVDAVPISYRRVNVPIFLGSGPLDYACACGAVVCQGIEPGDLAGLVVRCSCGAASRVPRAVPAPDER